MIARLPHFPHLISALQRFTPDVFAICMGTGMLSLLLPHLPGGQQLGQVLWVFNGLLFLVLTALWMLQMVLEPASFQNMLRHPVQSLFVGTYPMALATIVNGLLTYGFQMWGMAAIHWATVLWGVDVALSLLSGLLLPYLMFSRQEQPLSQMTALWLVPIVPAEVAGVSAAQLIPHVHEALAGGLFVAGYLLWACSVPLAFMVLTVLLLRLTQHHLPSRERTISMFLPVGPLATGAQGLLQMGEVAPGVLKNLSLIEFAPVFQGVGMLGGITLWGTALWWLLLAVALTLRTLKQGLPFNLGWWGLTFPLGVFVATAFSLEEATHLKGFSL
ncbi:C4-dicarboxylate ABC transporter, partial [Deinococcus cellulosilyticus]